MKQSLFTNKFTKGLIFIFSFAAFSFFSVSQANATTYNVVYYSTNPTNLATATRCSDTSGCNMAATCWNSEYVGVTNCGNPVTACYGGSVWTKYVVDYCVQTAIDIRGNETCERSYVASANTCSTGDKYNSENRPVMNAGSCDCSPKGAYKTCCSGTTLVNARHYATDPFAPDEADCGGATTIRCDGAGEPACGQAACDTLAPPSCTPGACDAAEPACGTTTYGSDGCSSCHKDGAACPTGCTPGEWRTVCTTSKC